MDIEGSLSFEVVFKVQPSVFAAYLKSDMSFLEQNQDIHLVCCEGIRTQELL